MQNLIPPSPPAQPLLSDAALCSWLGAAAPGDRFTYHRGFLARDASAQLQVLPEAERVALQKIAGRAFALFKGGLCDLVQRRHDFEDYSYLIVARRRPRSNRTGVLAAMLAEAA